MDKASSRSQVLVIVAMAIAFLSGCDGEGAKDPGRFPLAEEFGMDPGLLNEAYMEAEILPNLTSLLVSRSDTLIAEAYFNGSADTTLHDVRSVTKSFTSALIGIAIDRGLIESTEQTLAELLQETEPDLEGEVAGITLHQLLTMTTGQAWSEIPGPSEFNDFVRAPDQLTYALEKEFVATLGAKFNYSDGAAHIVSAILSEATGMSAFAYAGNVLLEPLDAGFYNYYVDNRGISYGGVGLMVTSRLLVNFGILYKNEGVFAGQRIIPADWVNESWKTHIYTGNIIPHGSRYGYYWWMGTENGHQVYFAMGYGGQFIVVVPDLDLVAVATNRFIQTSSPADVEWLNTLNLIFDMVLPSVKAY